MIDIRCTREGYECEGCCIKDKCDNLEQTNQVNLWEIYKQGRADERDEMLKNAHRSLRLMYEKGRADAIEEYKKKIEFEEKWLFDCKVFNPNVTIAFETLKKYAEQLKEQK